MDKEKPHQRNYRISRSCKGQLWVLFFLTITLLALYFSFHSFILSSMSDQSQAAEVKKIQARFSNDDFLRFHMGPRYLTPDNPNLIRYIMNRFGGPSRQSYNLTNPNTTDYSTLGQSKFVDELLGGRTGGFYVEAGARDGETGSKSLFFERQREWQGLLIEPNPISYRQLMFKRRQAFSLNACINIVNQAKILDFRAAGMSGSLMGSRNRERHEALKKHPEYPGHDHDVQCYPFSSIMDAAFTSHIDYMALHVHGNEMDVLKTIPFDKIVIDVVSVQFRITLADNAEKIDTLQTAAHLHEIRRLFEATNLYDEVGILPKSTNSADEERNGLDVFFQRRSNNTVTV